MHALERRCSCGTRDGGKGVHRSSPNEPNSLHASQVGKSWLEVLLNVKGESLEMRAPKCSPRRWPSLAGNLAISVLCIEFSATPSGRRTNVFGCLLWGSAESGDSFFVLTYPLSFSFSSLPPAVKTGPGIQLFTRHFPRKGLPGISRSFI